MSHAEEDRQRQMERYHRKQTLRQGDALIVPIQCRNLWEELNVSAGVMTTVIERYSTRDFHNRRADGDIILMFKQLIERFP